MNLLYIVQGKEKIPIKARDNDEIYILDIDDTEQGGIGNYINLLAMPQQNIILGKEFVLSYRIMLTVKAFLKKTDIQKIIFQCKYIDAYFTMQYLMYGGDLVQLREVCGKHCLTSNLEKNPYQFPYYWIKHLETECQEMIENYTCSNKRKLEPMLSIIIPYYNLGAFIKETILSIQKCSYKNYEIIIINDGSNDELSINVLNTLREEANIKVVDQENLGLSVARNVGAKIAQGEYITFLDADDLIQPHYYSRCINVLEAKADVDIIYSWVKYFESKDEVWPTFNLTLPYLLLSNMSAAFYVIRKEKFLKYGINRDEMRKGMEDYDSLISMHKHGCKGVSIPEPLVEYRYRLGSMSKAFSPKLIIEIYNEIIDHHKETFREYSVEIIKLINANGPGYLWNNPTLHYPSVCLNANEEINEVKFLLIRLMNTRLGKLAIYLLKLYKKKSSR